MKPVLYFFTAFILIFKADLIFAQDTIRQDSMYNSYGMLRNNDPVYTRKVIWIKPAVEVLGINALIWSIDRYLFDKDYSHTSTSTWKHNLKKGFSWDDDKLLVNFLGHPASGSLYFNAGRSNGYGYFKSFLYAVEGSLMWEYFGENTEPSYNDLINTTVTGSFLGEISYRLGSKILNDRKRGGERAVRELCGFLLSPVRGINRITQGKTFRVVDREVYQNEPLNITLFGGIHMVNRGTSAGTGKANPMLNIQLDYGDPFEIRTRKPFDVFRFRADVTVGTGLRIPYSVNGYGILGGKNYRAGKSIFLAGVFQQYDYWNNKYFQLSSIGIGPGVISRIPLGAQSDYYSSLHAAVVPLGGINAYHETDTIKYRNYNYAGGFEGKWENTVNFGKWVSIALNGYYYWMHTYVGYAGGNDPRNNSIGIVKPRITIGFSRNICIGAEQYFFYTLSRLKDPSAAAYSHTEQKFFLQIFLESPRRKGSRYN